MRAAGFLLLGTLEISRAGSGWRTTALALHYVVYRAVSVFLFPCPVFMVSWISLVISRLQECAVTQ